MRPDELEPMSDAMSDLLEAERPLDHVPAATRAQLFTRVTASVAALTAAGAAAGAASSVASSGTTAAAATGKAVIGGAAGSGTTAAIGGTLATKVIIAAVAFTVGGGVGATVHAVVVPRSPPPAPIVVRVEPQRPVEAAPVEPAPTVPVPEPVAAPGKAPAPQVTPSPLRPRDGTLEAERTLVEQARAALARHESGPALEALAQHEREFPQGQLTEERMALQVLALVEHDERAAAAARAVKFRARYPHSLLQPAVDAALAP
ncbi:MAG: hypothetical protein IPJ65_00140 [Archangiaceae bacterium]|nr:hypothetical protein [Archangiaceae bacterium]